MNATLSDDQSKQRFLLIQTAYIGDVVLATPLIETIKLHFPGSVIDIVLRKGNEDLFYRHPGIGRLYIWDKKRRGKYFGLLSIVKDIRGNRYDYCLNLQRHGTTGMLTLLSGAKVTVGFTMNPCSRFFTRTFIHKINPEQGLVHESGLYLQLLNGIVPDATAVMPRIYPSSEDFAFVAMTQRYITVAPASVWFTKQLPAARWVEVIDLIDDDLNVCLIGGPSDYQQCEAIKNQTKHSRTLNFAGKFTLLQSAALMKGALMNYANDSAPVHLASAVNAPITAIFCSTVPAFGYGPLSEHSRVVETDRPLSCRPCGPHGHRNCPRGHFLCSDIPAETIVDKVTSFHD